MQTMRLLLLAAVLVTGIERPAAAQGTGLILPKVDVVHGNPVVSEHVKQHAAQLQSCAAKGEAAKVKARVRIRWDATGRVRAISVRGATAAFRRCVKQALSGDLPTVQQRAGSGSATFIVEKPTSPDPLAMTPPSP